MDNPFSKLIVHSFTKHNFQIRKDYIRNIIQGLIKLLEGQGGWYTVGGLM
jgi:hypothetical protein